MERRNIINLPLGKHPPKVVNATVEIPKGSRNKYEYDKEREQYLFVTTFCSVCNEQTPHQMSHYRKHSAVGAFCCH